MFKHEARKDDGPARRVPEPIVAAVAQTLVRSGIQRFSLSAAADEAGVSRGTIYNWFGGKKKPSMSPWALLPGRSSSCSPGR